jgi:hypothetical protein
MSSTAISTTKMLSEIEIGERGHDAEIDRRHSAHPTHETKAKVISPTVADRKKAAEHGHEASSLSASAAPARAAGP